MANDQEIAGFLDACIFLEYRPLREIDWRKLLGANAVRLVLTMPVLNALDKFKTDRRRQQRAERALNEIRTIWNNNNTVSDGVTLESLDESVRRADFPPGFDPDSEDDHLILQLANYNKAHPGIDTLMVSEDGGMELKCRARGIAYVHPDSGLRLESVSDEAAKEIQRLRQEIEALKSRRPSVVVGFFNEETIVDLYSFTLGVHRDLQIVDIQEAKGLFAESQKHYGGPTKPAFDAYLNECQKHNDATEELSKVLARCFEAEIVVGNVGTSPAHNLDVHIAFPQSMFVKEAEKVKAPAQPDWPRGKFDLLEPRVLLSSGPELSGIHLPFQNLWAKLEPHEDGAQLHINVKELKQHQPEVLHKLILGFPFNQHASSFHADYRVTANELPQPVNGQLHFQLIDVVPGLHS